MSLAGGDGVAAQPGAQQVQGGGGLVAGCLPAVGGGLERRLQHGDQAIAAANGSAEPGAAPVSAVSRPARAVS